MKTIKVPTRDQVDAKAQQILDKVKGQLGMIPNLYATIAYSSDSLENYLNFSGKAGKQSFSNKELEVIKLAVSEVNACEYCLAAHTAIAKMNGFTEEETIQIRNQSIADNKLNVLSKISSEMAQNSGNASNETKQAFFDLGYGEKELIDLAAVVIDISFTNYVHNLTKIPVDFPKAKPLSEKVV